MAGSILSLITNVLRRPDLNGCRAGFPRSIKSNGGILLLGATVFLLSFEFFRYISNGLPILRELRGFLLYNGFIGNINLLQEVFHPTGSIGSEKRIVTMYFIAFQNKVCGYEPFCINILQSIALALDATLLFFHLTQISRKCSGALIITLLWCTSLPAVGSILWQDTQFDKLAMIFSLIYLIVLFHFVEKKEFRIVECLYSNVILSIVLFLAFKAKEYSFYILPITLLVLFINGIRYGKRTFYVGFVSVVVPLVYGAYHIQNVIRNMPESWRAHTAGGDIASVIPKLSGILIGYGDVLGMGNWGEDYTRLADSAAIVMLTTIGLITLSGFVALKRQYALGKQLPHDVANTVWNLVYLLGIIGVSAVILAKTDHPAAYYLLVVEGAFLGVLVFAAYVPVPGISSCWDDLRRIVLLTLLSGSVILAFLSQMTSGSGPYRLKTMARAINDSFATIRVTVPVDEVKDAQFYFSNHIDGEWYFFYSLSGQQPDPEMMSAVYQKVVQVPTTYIFGPRTAPAAGTLQVMWGEDGIIRSIYLGNKTLLKRP